MLGSCPHDSDLPPPVYPPHVERAWAHYCAATAGSVAGGVDHWDLLCARDKVACLKATETWDCGHLKASSFPSVHIIPGRGSLCTECANAARFGWPVRTPVA